MAQISVADAARRLGVGVARVHQRIADGSLPALRIGSQWVVDEGALDAVSEARAPGRRLSARSVWALVAVSEDDQGVLDQLAPVEQARARDRLRQLLAASRPGAKLSEDAVTAVASLIRSRFRGRASRVLYRASPRDLPDLRADHRVLLSGLSHSSSGIAAGDVVEGYAHTDDLSGVVEDHLLSPAGNRNANVVLHVHAGQAPATIRPLMLAADLAEHRRPREDVRAIEILQQIAHEHPELRDAHRSSTDRRAPK